MADEPDNLVLQLLRQIREDVAGTHALLSVLRDELKGDMQSLRADMASDLMTMQAKDDAEHKATREQIVGLRRALVEYHSAVPGHGVLISDLETRVRQLERKAGLSDA